jgi:methyl-accepting chemotaxis protein
MSQIVIDITILDLCGEKSYTYFMILNKNIFFLLITTALFAIVSGVIIYFLLPGLAMGSIVFLSGLLTGLSLIKTEISRRMLLLENKKLAREIDNINNEGGIDFTNEINDSLHPYTKNLTKSINDLTQRLNTIFLDINRSTRKFNLFASDIFFSARHMSQQSHQQSDAMEKILDRVSQFQDALNQLNQEINVILDKLESTSKIYSDLGDLSKKSAARLDPLVSHTFDASREVESGLQNIKNSSETIYTLVKMMSDLQKSMEDMVTKTSKVSGVIKNLDDIAEKTHVLATNASIEAARAGKQGASFSVIAAEVRQLAANSRTAIKDVGDFLRDITKDINSNTQNWAMGVEKIQDVQHFGNTSHDVMNSINKRLHEINQAMNDFQDQFNNQDSIISDTLVDSAEVSDKIKGFSKTLNEQSSGYALIQEQVNQASQGAESTSKSASVLSQLATYLKVGGKELQYAVKDFKTSYSRYLKGLDRHELRRGLLYNLEVFYKDDFIGNLGDISQSGLLLYSDKEFSLNKEFYGVIHLPIGFSERTSLGIYFTPRRSHPDGKTFRIGCSMRLADSWQEGEFDEILEKLTISDRGDENVENDQQDDELEELEEI